MELKLTKTSVQTHPGHFEDTWFLDLKQGNSLEAICNGSKDFCLQQKDIWAARLQIDGSDEHQQLKTAGFR